ncbi:MAG: ABC transporter permease, partial [Acidobacteriales bacterium]|nr:ABC transporter permease [Terriglobales bacterium]
MGLPFTRSLTQLSFSFYKDNGERTTARALFRPSFPGYFETMQTRLLAGRYINEDDTESSQRVAVIDDTLAKSVWPDQSPLGQKLAVGSNPRNPPAYITVVGVVENLRLTNLTGERAGQVYTALAQFSSSSLSYVVRTRRDAQLLIEPVRAEVHALDPNIPIYDVSQLDLTVAEQRAPQRLVSLLMAFFAMAGIVLALVGVFGVISFTV